MKETITLFDFFVLGGPVMWPLAVFSILASAIILERIIFFLTKNFNTRDLADRICKKVSTEGDDAALALLDKENPRLVCIPVFRAILESETTDMALKKATLSASEQVARAEKYLSFLSAIGTVAPITGFLGTVTGMISAFMSIAEADNISARLAATGIFQALITTAFGLVIAVVAIVFYHAFTGVADRFAFSLENSCNLILAIKKDEDKK